VVSWKWVGAASALAAHREQLAIYGGGDGIRDAGLLESALARPQNLAAYGEPDAAALAAAYAFGIARNKPFVDGNKRVALMVCEAFLNKNGFGLDVRNAELVPIFLDVAAGQISENELAVWIRERIAPLS
jgi:death-on-curing protein